MGKIITVRFISGAHVTNTIGGQRASSTSSYERAAKTLLHKIYPGPPPALRHRPELCSAGREAFEIVDEVPA